METNENVLNPAVQDDCGSLSTKLAPTIDNLLNNTNYWHKITVRNVRQFHRDIVLKAIVDGIFPVDIIPVNYHLEGDDGCFLVRNCKLLLEKLCSLDLFIPNPTNANFPFTVSMFVAVSANGDLERDVQTSIHTVLLKRYNPKKKLLNLSSFHSDHDLPEYCPLYLPKILYFVLSLSFSKFEIQRLILSNNDIRSLTSFHDFDGIQSLVSLDLHNNSIKSITDLDVLASKPLRQLGLAGNPLCEDYDDEFTYLDAVKKICPRINTLDRIYFGKKGLLPFKCNSLCHIDGKDVVDQFLEHFFTIYDSDNRAILRGLYHTNAIFSVACSSLLGQINKNSTLHLGTYKCMSRNLLLSDFSKSEDHLIIGNDKIIKTLCKLPTTQHAPDSFKVDLMYYTEKTAIISVAGIFGEVENSLLDRAKIFGFSRTFVLTALANGEYKIINDQLHVSNATCRQQKFPFKYVRVQQSDRCRLDCANTDQDKEALEQTFMQITELNIDWSKKCLEDCQYNFKSALELFVKLHKIDLIPIEAFSPS